MTSAITEAASIHVARACQQCGVTDRKLSLCARCHIEQYCSRVCQAAAWPRHKLVCQERPKAQVSATKGVDLVASFCDLTYADSSPHEVSDDRLSDMLLAAKYGNCSAMEKCLDSIKDPNQPAVQDAFCLAAVCGKVEVMELMILKGVNPAVRRYYDRFKHKYPERLTAMGNAIKYRQPLVITLLLKYGIEVSDIYRKTKWPLREQTLDLFFSEHRFEGPNPSLLHQLLHSGAKISPLKPDTIFTIAAWTSIEELRLLIEAGLDSRAIYIKEDHLDFKGKDCSRYTSETSLLDLAVMRAERANIFNENQEAIDMVALLLEKGADAASCRNYCNQNYLHRVSNPKLVKMFCEAGVDRAASALFDKYRESLARPIDIAHTEDVIKVLCEGGEEIANSPFTKGTPAHNQALERIGFDKEKGLDQLDAKGQLFLEKAVETRDVSAFVALIGEGVDVNQANPRGSMWTVMHQLFASVYSGSVCEGHDYVRMAEDYHLRLINMLIKCGAKPLRDVVGRTPLMCLNFNPFNLLFNHAVIRAYIDWEAAYYRLDPEEYKEKFLKLRQGGFDPDPLPSVFESFWRSFEDHSEFSPVKRHDPIAEWNRMREFE